jgi:hypothetical protein
MAMQTIKTMWKAIFQNKLTIYKANLPSFVQKIIKSRCYVDLSRRLRLKSHPKMAAWERLIAYWYHCLLVPLLIGTIWLYQTPPMYSNRNYAGIWARLTCLGMKNYWTDGTKPKEWVDSSVCVCICRLSSSNSWFQVTESIPFRNRYFMYFILKNKYTLSLIYGNNH